MVHVRLRNPDRDVSVAGPLTVQALLATLDVHPLSVLVIRGDELLPKTAVVTDDDVVELRPVISGGSR